MLKKITICLVLIALIGIGMQSCNNMDSELIKDEITISGEVVIDSNLSFSKINFSIFHAISGIGFQEHPLYEIESFTSNDTSISYTFGYNSLGNTGLVVYAWIDLDEDGILCTPASRIDLAGVDVNESFPTTNSLFSVKINTPCVGPDWFYPSSE